MQIDRARFLMLTAGIAAGGCPPAQTPSAPAIAAKELPGGKVTVAEPIESKPAGDGETLDQPEATEVKPEVKATDGEESADSASLAAACDGLKPPSSWCESFDDTKSTCQKFGRGLAPPAAKAAVDCLVRKSGTQAICQYDVVERCFAGAVAGYSKQGSAKTCQTVMARCSSNRWRNPELSEGSCRRALAAVKASVRDGLVSCMKENCALGTCAYWLGD